MAKVKYQPLSDVMIAHIKASAGEDHEWLANIDLMDESTIYAAELLAMLEEAKQHTDENGNISHWDYRMRISFVKE